jgi:hypothetical protein
MDYWGHVRGRQRTETVPHLGVPLLVEDVRMDLERMRDDRWSKEDALPPFLAPTLPVNAPLE